MSEYPAHVAAGPAADPQFGPWLAQASILVVDDEPGMRNFLVKILGPRCKLIAEAADTKQASKPADRRPAQAAVLQRMYESWSGPTFACQPGWISSPASSLLTSADCCCRQAPGGQR
jgi:hypothetical protein